MIMNINYKHLVKFTENTKFAKNSHMNGFYVNDILVNYSDNIDIIFTLKNNILILKYPEKLYSNNIKNIKYQEIIPVNNIPYLFFNNKYWRPMDDNKYINDYHSLLRYCPLGIFGIDYKPFRITIYGELSINPEKKNSLYLSG